MKDIFEFNHIDESVKIKHRLPQRLLQTLSQKILVF